MSALDDKILRFSNDTDLAHQLIHGDEQTVVVTEGGPVDSFAKVIHENRLALTSSFDFQIKDVNKAPTTGQFGSIAAAVASITDASINKPYVVRVAPGVYLEPKIVAKEFVVVECSGFESTYIQPIDPTDHLVEGTINSALVRATLTGVTGLDKALVHMDHPEGISTMRFRLEQVRFGDADTLVLAESGFVQVNSCAFGSEFTYRRGFVTKDQGEMSAGISLRATSANGMTFPYPEVVFQADGPLSQLIVLSMSARASNSISEGGGDGIGVHARNGGRIRIVGGSLIGFDKAVWSENAGVAPKIECVGINLAQNNQDLLIEHPGSTGSFTGNATRTKVQVNEDVLNFALFYSDSTGDGIVNLGPMYVGADHNTLADIEPLISRGMPVGLLDGGTLTKGTGLNVNVAAGRGYVKIGHHLKDLSWPATVFPVAASAVGYIYLHYHDNAIEFHTSGTVPNASENIVLGRYMTSTTGVITIGSQGALNIEQFNPNLDKFLKEVLGPLFVSGCLVSENATTPRAINVTQGHYFYSTVERFPDEQIIAPVILGRHVAGVGTFVPVSQLPNTHYDNGTNLVTLTPGFFTKHVIYSTGDGANVALVGAYGTINVETLDEAKAAANPPLFISPDGSPAICAIIVQQGVNNIAEIVDLRSRVGFSATTGGSGLSRHGDLTGLTGDDHPQYVRLDGARAMTGIFDMGTNNIINVGTIDDVDVSGHASRHLPNGADALATAAAITVTNKTTNTVGVANSFARSDHTHVVSGFQPLSPNLTNLAVMNGIGYPKMLFDGTWSLALLAAGDIPSLDWSKIASGKPTTLAGYGITDAVQTNVIREYGSSVAPLSSTSSVPVNNTVPVITAGTEVWSMTVTPKTADSDFKIQCDTHGDASSSGQHVTLLLFRKIGTGAAVCIGANPSWVESNGDGIQCSISAQDSPATASPVTYSMRCGRSAGGTWYLGRRSGSTFGGAARIPYSITEYKP